MNEDVDRNAARTADYIECYYESQYHDLGFASDRQDFVVGILIPSSNR